MRVKGIANFVKSLFMSQEAWSECLIDEEIGNTKRQRLVKL